MKKYTYETVELCGKTWFVVYYEDFYLRSFEDEAEAIRFCEENNHKGESPLPF